MKQATNTKYHNHQIGTNNSGNIITQTLFVIPSAKDVTDCMLFISKSTESTFRVTAISGIVLTNLRYSMISSRGIILCQHISFLTTGYIRF